MDKVSSRLRVGEKIGLAFAIVGLLFAGVVWHYHQTLQSVLDDYRDLQAVFEVRKSLALEIEIEMAAAREAEKDFLLQHQEHFADEVDQHLRSLREKVAALGVVDQQSRQTAEALQRQVAIYQKHFDAVTTAWRSMGLDENSGIQGAFRRRIHLLHELSAQYNVDRLYTALLQIRRSEKDLALRQDPAYRERVRTLIAEFRQLLKSSELQEAVRQKLLAELAVYSRTFEVYAEIVLRPGNSGGGKGPFRDAAHRIEAILDAYHVPNLETNVLQLRRWEKDFLLRGDDSYPQRVVDIARALRSQISASPISDADKALLIGLLRDYQSGFLVLVSQSAKIRTLTKEMNSAADRVAPLLKQNVDQANQLMAARAREISESSQAGVRAGLVVMFCAVALATLFAALITLRIVRPVRQMAGLLDDLAYGTPTERVPTVHGGRNEINAMGESLNALLDHRANFLAWWKESMNELNALRDLNSAGAEQASDDAAKDLRAAAAAKVQQLNGIRARVLQHTDHILGIAERLHAGGTAQADDAKSLEHAAQGIATLLAVLAVEATPPTTAATRDAEEETSI